MPEFRYRAINVEGHQKNGVLEARDEAALGKALEKEGYYLLEAMIRDNKTIDKGGAKQQAGAAPTGIECMHCGKEIRSDAKFCRECGTKQDFKEYYKSSTVPVESASIPTSGITIEFRYSTAQTFDLALDEARKHPSFQQIGDGKKATYRLTYEPQELVDATELLEYLKGWRHRTVYIDGKKAAWDSVFSFSWCLQNRQMSYKPDFYCYGYEHEHQFNIWGCIQADLPFTDGAGWFCWGKFLNDKLDWEFDKGRISHELQKNLYHYRFCPALNEDRLKEVLGAFPETVNPTNDPNWKLIQNYNVEDGDGPIATITDEYGLTSKVVLEGVCPKGRGALQEIEKRLKYRFPAV